MILDGLTAFITTHPFITLGILVALAFDFVNGFHDSANAIATVVATKVLTPAQALSMAAFFNFLGPFAFGTLVAAAVGGGIVNGAGIPAGVLPAVIFAALVGAIAWNLVTWYVGLPSSSSHALVGGLVGAGLAAAGPSGVILPTWEEFKGIGQWIVTGALYGIALGLAAWGASRLRMPRALIAPFGVVGALGLGSLYFVGHPLPLFTGIDVRPFVEYGLTLFTIGILGAIIGGVIWVATQQKMGAQLVPGFALFGSCVTLVVVFMNVLKMTALSKTVIFMVVSPILGFFAGFLLMSLVSWFAIKMNPGTVSKTSKRMQLFSSAFYALTHGTNDGQKTMASKITHLTPIQGFAAETGGGVVLVGMAQAGIPVSTTHAITASIMGVGATKRTSAVSWGMGRRIVGAWVLTMPAAAIVGYIAYVALRAFTG